MAKPKKIPIARAKELSKQYGYDGIVIFGINPNTRDMCTTTYGASKKLCSIMEKFGKEINQLVFENPERFTHD